MNTLVIKTTAAAVICLLIFNTGSAKARNLDSSDISYVYKSSIVEGTLRVVKSIEMTGEWQCSHPCYSVTIGFSIAQPQSNYRFIALSQSGELDKTGRARQY